MAEHIAAEFRCVLFVMFVALIYHEFNSQDLD